MPLSRPLTRRVLAAAAGFLLLVSAASARQTTDPLPRAGFLGAQVEPLGDEVRKAHELPDDAQGILVRSIIEGSAAAEAGLQAGDLLVSVDGNPVADPATFVSLVGGRGEGTAVRIEFVRGKESKAVEARLKGRPRESSAAYETIYASIVGRNGRQRTILTRPAGEGPFPVLYLIQGLGCFSVENPSGPLDPYAKILDAFTKAGFATFRVEKPGCGDSEGGPCSEVDFPTELEGYRQGLKELRGMPSIDPERIVILGHSMGGVMGPILAAETPVRGLIVYGTVTKTWMEYTLENIRRQVRLGGAADAEVDRVVKNEARFQSLLLYGGKSIAEIAGSDPVLAEHIGQMTPDVRHLYGRNPEFFRQLNDLNLAEYWSKVDADVLAIHGEADFVSDAADHEQIARIVNEAHPRRGRYMEMADTDHGFEMADTELEALRRSGPGEMNPAALQTLLDWASELAAKARDAAPGNG
jgi:pimeloyl-ACP methyl ester carboxylesterase